MSLRGRLGTLRMWFFHRRSIQLLKHTRSIREYVKEFFFLMLEILNITKEELLFNLHGQLIRLARARTMAQRCVTLRHCYSNSKVIGGL